MLPSHPYYLFELASNNGLDGWQISFTPINSDNSFVHSRRLPEPEILATESQVRLIESLPHDPVFDTKGIANLHGFLAVYWDLIERRCPEFKAFVPSLQHLTSTIDSIREKDHQPKLTTEWEYGHLLFPLLDRPALHRHNDTCLRQPAGDQSILVSRS